MSKKALVVGLQRSGHAAVRLLQKEGYQVCVTINNSLTDEDKNKLNNVEIFENGHPFDLLDINWEFIVKNPGVPYRIPFIQEALKRNIRIISEIELGYLYSNNINLALTGTNGKTTTTTLIYNILSEYFNDVYCGGNIGLPLCDIVYDHPENNKIVLELSSFQLMGIETFKPHIATILNLAPDHLDYMDTVEAYYESKMSIYKNQTLDDYFLLNEDDELVLKYVKDVKATILKYSLNKESDAYLKDNWLYYKDEPIINTNKIQIIGRHNLYNILVALMYAKIMGVSNECIQKVVYEFKGVEYRLERVTGFKNNLYYNDSKSTTPDSTLIALKALEDKEVILILGGFEKGLDFNELITYINNKSNIKEVLTFGQIKDNFNDLNTQVTTFEDLDQVMQYIKDNIDEQVILFSPATSSFDQYLNYEKRGQHFNTLIKR